MKVRVKFNGESHRVDLGDRPASAQTLLELMQAVAGTLQMDIGNINVSLNQIEFLSGDDTPLSDFGIVSGDLIYVTRTDGIENIPTIEDAPQRSQPLSSWTSSGASSASSSAALPLNANNDISSGSLMEKQNSSGEASDEINQKSSNSDSSLNVGENFDPDTTDSLMSQPTVNRFLLEPLAVRESTADQVPAILNQLFNSLECGNKNEALWVVLHTLMIECGFMPSGNGNLTSMPDDWKQTAFYSCNYEYAVTPHIVSNCMIVGVTMGSSISIHGISKGESNFQTDHVQLKADHFVRTLSSDAPTTYRALDRLSRQFKDVICLPLINHLSRSAGMGEEHGLLALPCELRIRLLSYLDATSICHLGATCCHWNAVYKDNIVWRRLYLRNFLAPSDCSLQRDWYELYKDKHIMMKKDQEQRQRLYHFVDDYPPQRPFPLPPGFGPGGRQPFFPHIIGGDYDVNPEFASGLRGPMMNNLASNRRNHRDIATRRGRTNLAGRQFSGWI